MTTTHISDFFKLMSLEVSGFKNLDNPIKIDFENRDGITLLIGGNGCGKSNLLEAISSIFAGLYKNRTHKPTFNYTIHYHIQRNDIDISLKNGTYTFVVNGEIISKTNFESKRDVYLPKNVIASYSGECQRLFDEYYWPYYNDYISAVKKSDKIPELPLIYINRYSWDLALLTLFFYDFEHFTQIANFCHKTLGIKDVKSIIFTLNTKKIKEWKDNSVLQMVKSLFTIEEHFYFPDSITLTLEEIKSKLSYMTEKQFFETMYAACMPKTDKIITNIEINFTLNNKKESQITVHNLSEGEKKYLLMMLILEVIGDENSLLLFDEPDSHIHITRKAELKNIYAKFSNRENIITTHSPTLATCFDMKHIVGLGTNNEGNCTSLEKQKNELVSEITGGVWNIHEQNSFLASNKKIILLVEGKTDKEHIENAFNLLKEDYPSLDFDVFYMNGETFIRQTLIGLSNCEIKWNKKFIGVFDNDKAGNEAVKGFLKEGDYFKIKNHQIVSENFLALLLPKSSEFKNDEQYTIENCYGSSKYEEAYDKAFQQKKGYFSNLSVDKISEDIKGRSKTILAEMSKEFSKEDVENGFKPIFDIISKISNNGIDKSEIQAEKSHSSKTVNSKQKTEDHEEIGLTPEIIVEPLISEDIQTEDENLGLIDFRLKFDENIASHIAVMQKLAKATDTYSTSLNKRTSRISALTSSKIPNVKQVQSLLRAVANDMNKMSDVIDENEPKIKEYFANIVEYGVKIQQTGFNDATIDEENNKAFEGFVTAIYGTRAAILEGKSALMDIKDLEKTQTIAKRRLIKCYDKLILACDYCIKKSAEIIK